MGGKDTGAGFEETTNRADLVARFLAEARASVARMRAQIGAKGTDPETIDACRAALRHEAH
ncbi:MAG: hypothetical protein ACPGVX_08825, partial [Thalassobaculaceae bacterium]